MLNFHLLLLVLIVVLFDRFIGIVLNGYVCFLFINIEIKLLLLHLLVCVIKFTNLVMVIIKRQKIISLKLWGYLHTVCIYLVRFFKLISDYTQLWRITLPSMDQRIVHIFLVIAHSKSININSISTVYNCWMEWLRGRQTWWC